MENTENQNSGKNQVNPQEQEDNLINKNAAPNEGKTNNWDEREILNRNPQGTRPEHERSNLNPDREKRAGSGGSGLNPDRNSGDR